jgi:uncharacterized membrane protein
MMPFGSECRYCMSGIESDNKATREKDKQERKTIIGIVYSVIAIIFVALGFILTVFGKSMTLNNLVLNEILSIRTVGLIVFFSGFIIFLSKFYS